MPETTTETVKAQLGLWDTVSIILGIVVGVSIFKAPPAICSNVAAPWQAMATWLLGGLLALVGALCYAELATTYPRSGGDYVYLTRAFGRWVGFLFGWAQLVAILTGSVGVMAYVVADYGVELLALDPSATVLIAGLAVVVLTLINCFGVQVGKTAQNVLTVAKILGVSGVLLTGILLGAADLSMTAEAPATGPGFGLAMVLVLYTYGGWNDAAFVTAEIRDPRRNIPRALFLGIGIITFLYLLMNVAYMKSLGFEGLRTAGAPAADVLKLSVGMWASKSMSLLVMISGLGAINGMLLTGSRVFLALGQDHPLFAGLGRWYTKRGAPVWSLLAQAGVALLMIVMVGTRAGRALIDTVFRWLRMPPLDWSDFVGGFETLIAGTAPVFWFFFLLTGISLLVLRIKDRGMARGFSVPLFPVPPLIFCGMCLFMLWSSVTYAKSLSLLGILPLAAGLPLYVVSQRRRDAK